MSYAACLNARKLSEATCLKQVAFSLKTKECLFLGPEGLSGSQEQRSEKKLRSVLEPKHRCLVYTSDRNPVCTRHRQSLMSVFTWLQPHQNSSDSADTVITSPHWQLTFFIEILLIVSESILEKSGLVSKPYLQKILFV